MLLNEYDDDCDDQACEERRYQPAPIRHPFGVRTPVAAFQGGGRMSLISSKVVPRQLNPPGLEPKRRQAAALQKLFLWQRLKVICRNRLLAQVHMTLSALKIGFLLFLIDLRIEDAVVIRFDMTTAAFTAT